MRISHILTGPFLTSGAVMQYVLPSMKRIGALAFFASLAFVLAGCGVARMFRENREDRRAVRAGLEKFLAEYKNGSKEGFHVEILELNFDRDRAAIQVQIQPGDGSGSVTMVRYNLRRWGSDWVVMRSRHLNGPILHPQIEAGQPKSPSGSVPHPAKGPAAPSIEKP